MSNTTFSRRPLTALSKLSCSEFVHVMSAFRGVTTFVRVLFCALAVVVIVADVMIVANALYFSNVAEKVCASNDLRDREW